MGRTAATLVAAQQRIITAVPDAHVEYFVGDALDTYADYLIGANRYRHGRDVLLPAGHLPPCEELRELWTGYGQTAPACETVTAAPASK